MCSKTTFLTLNKARLVPMSLRNEKSFCVLCTVQAGKQPCEFSSHMPLCHVMFKPGFFGGK